MAQPMPDELLEGWSESEQDIAKQAFAQAYQRTIERLIADLQAKTKNLNSAEAIWQLHDFLSIERHTIEGRFSFRAEGILFVFASFVKDDLLQIDELAGLDAEKLAKVSAMSRF
jgi:hypothetical protein